MAQQNHSGSIRAMTGFSLKVTAGAAMFGDHLAKVFHLTGLPLFILSHLAGRIAFPLFCFLLAEGYFCTADVRKYTGRVLILGIVSEPLFDLTLYGSLFWPGAQNTCFTLALGLVLFGLLDRIRDSYRSGYRKNGALQIVVILIFALAAHLLRTDYGASGIGALACFYLGRAHEFGTRKHKPFPTIEWSFYAYLAACVCLNLDGFGEPAAFLCVPVLLLYNGRRGYHSRAVQYAFYLFYPLHLALLILLRSLLP